MSNIQKIAELEREITNLKRTPISHFGSLEDKKRAIQQLEEDIRSLKKVMNPTSRNLPNEVERGIQRITGRLSVFETMLDLWNNMKSTLTGTFFSADRDEIEKFCKDCDKLKMKSDIKIYTMFENTDLIEHDQTRNMAKLLVMIFVGKLFEEYSTKSMSPSMFEKLLNLIIGCVLKYRVELATDIVLQSMGIRTKQDVNFCDKMDINSIRTPDFLNVNNGVLCLLETNFSSRNVKGVYSKGMNITCSKYYEEMYYAHTRLDMDIVYCPLIFYHEMSVEVKYKELSEDFINAEGDLHSHDVNLSNFFKILRKFSQHMGQTKSERKSLMEDLNYILPIIDIMNNQIYPRGKVMNMCFSCLNDKKFANEVVDLSFGVKKVVEYNERMLLITLKEIGLSNIMELLHYVFSGERPSRDPLRLKKQSMWFKRNFDNVMENDFLITEPEVKSGFRKIFDLVCNYVGVEFIGSNSRREKLLFIMEYEEISRMYFNLIDISYNPKYDLKDKIDITDPLSIPKFVYVKNPSPPKLKSLKVKEMKRNVELESFESLYMNAPDYDLPNLDLTLVSEPLRYHLVMTDNEIEELVFRIKKVPVNVTVHCVGESVLLLALTLIYDNFVMRSFENSKINEKDVLIELSDSVILTEVPDEQEINQVIEILNDVENLISYDRINHVAILRNITEQKFVYLKGKDLLFKPRISTNQICEKLLKFTSELQDNFTKFKFDSIRGVYIQDYRPKASLRETLTVMSELSLSQEVCTKRNRTVEFSEIYCLFPESTLVKPDPSIIPPSELSEDSITDYAFESFDLDSQDKLIARMKSKVVDDKGFKRQGFIFHKDHVNFKGLKLSYDSPRVRMLLKTTDKLRRNVVFRKPYSDMIDRCNRKKLESEGKGWKEKVYKPTEEEIDQFEGFIDEMSKIESVTEMPVVIDDDLFNMISDTSIKTISEDFLKLIFENSCISTYYRISKLYGSLSFESSKWRTRKNETISYDENLKNVCYHIIDSKKITNDITKVRYFMMMKTDGSFDNEHSYFKNRDEDEGISFTNVHEEDIEILRFRSNLFYNVMNLFFYYYRKNILENQNIVKGFIKLYNLLFTLSTSTKNILSVFKYLNVINFADYSNPLNLFKKYFSKDKHRRLIHFSFMRSIMFNYNCNFTTLRGCIDVGDEMHPIRDMYNIDIPLETLWGTVYSIKDMIELNTFYNLVEKKTTQMMHSMKNFLSTIEENNLAMKDCNEEGFDLHDVTADMVSRDSMSFYCRESIYYGINLVMSDIFLNLSPDKISDKVVAEQFGRTKRKHKLDKQFFSEILTDRCYERFSKNFLSSRKSMSMKVNPKSGTLQKLRMIDTTLEFINLVFEGQESMSPVAIFEKTMSLVENDEMIAGKNIKYFCGLSTVTRKEQHESDREIYVLFVATKILTVFVQHVFYAINMLIEEEMVVKPQIDKLDLIKNITSRIYELPRNYEIVFMNGDMASWSGRDIYKKFLFAVDCLSSTGYVSKTVMNMTKFCLEMTSSMRVLVPENYCKSNKLDPSSYVWNDHFKCYETKYTHSWPQGIFHNISSFIHACEQRLKSEALSLIGINKSSHKFLDHSDDKNEIVALKLDSFESYVKYSNYFPAFFSLKPSLTKDSFSRMVSEMVGLQNIRGRLFDNPVKTLRDVSTRVKSPFFIQCYKSSLSSISEFYNKSNDVVTSYFFNLVSYTSLKQLFGINTSKLKFLPVSYGGFYRLSFDAFTLHGLQSDIVDKSDLLSRFRIDVYKLFKEYPIVMRFFRDKNMRLMIKRLKAFKTIDKLKFDIDQPANIVVDNITRSKIAERIEMFRKRDSFTDLMNLKNKSSNKILLGCPDSSLIIGQDEIDSLISKCAVSYQPEIPSEFVTDDKIIETLLLIKSREIQLHNSYVPSDIREMNNHTLDLVRNKSMFSTLDLDSIKELLDGEFNKFFLSYRNFKRKDEIAIEFQNICNFFNLDNAETFEEKKGLLELTMDSDVSRSLIQYRPGSSTVGTVDFYADFVRSKEIPDESDSLMKLKSRKLMISPHSNFVRLSQRLKVHLNRKLIKNELWATSEIISIFDSENVSLSDFLNKEKDEYLKCVVRYSYQRNKSKFGTVVRPVDYQRREYFKKRILYRSEDYKSEISVILNKENIIVDLFVREKEEYSYFFIDKKLDVNDCNKRLFYMSTKEPLYVKFENLSNYDQVKDSLGNDGFVLLSNPKNILLNDTCVDKSLIRHGDFFEIENKNSMTLRIVKPRLYTEEKEFKKSLFNICHLSTNLSGGVLNPESQKTDLCLLGIQRYKPRIRIGKKPLNEFYRLISSNFKRRFWNCYMNLDHNHDDDSDILCLHTLNFKKDGEHIDMDFLIDTALEYDHKNSTNFYPVLSGFVACKNEEFRKKGRVTGGEILIPRDTDNRNLFVTTYKITEDSSLILLFLMLLEKIIDIQINDETLDPDTKKDNINLYRTIKLIIETDDRFERRLMNVSEAYSRYEEMENSMIRYRNLNCKQTMKQYNSQGLGLGVDGFENLLIFMSKHFSFDGDLDYKSRLFRIDKKFKMTYDDVSELELSRRISKSKRDLEQLDKEREARLEDMSKFIPRETLDTQLEIEVKKEKKRLLDESIEERLAASSEISVLKRELKKSTKEVEELKEQVSMLSTIVRSQDEEIADLKGKLKSREDEVYILNAEKEDLKDDIKEIQSELKLARSAPKYQISSDFGFRYFSDGEESNLQKEKKKDKINRGQTFHQRNVRNRNIKVRKAKKEEEKRLKEESDRKALEEEERRIKEEEMVNLRRKEEENSKKERSLMRIEEVLSPKRYRNFFRPYFDPKYKSVKLYFIQEINPSLDVDVYDESQPSQLSKILKSLTIAFHWQYKGMIEDLFLSPDSKYRIGLLRSITETSPSVYLKEHDLPCEFTSQEAINYQSVIYRDLMDIMKTLSDSVKKRYNFKANACYYLKGLKEADEETKIQASKKLSKDLFEHLLRHFEMRLNVHNRVYLMLKKLIELSSFMWKSANDNFIKKMIANEGVMDESDSDYVNMRKRMTDTMRAMKHVHDSLNGVVDFLRIFNERLISGQV